jgi:signal transduction histidine kinase/CheY-like chemotaxis protein
MHGTQRAMLASVAKFDAMGEVGQAELRLKLASLLRQHPEISELRWIGSNGKEQFLESRLGLTLKASGRDWSNDPLFQGAHTSQEYVGEVHFVNESEPYVAMGVARDAGSSVLAAEVNLRYVWDLIAQAHPQTGGVAYVVDRIGQLISHPDIGLVFAKTNMSGLAHVRSALDKDGLASTLVGGARDIKAQEVVSFAVPIPRLGWTVFAEQSVQEAFRPVYASIARSVSLVALGVAAAMAISLLLARRMVRPIREIERGARQLGEGKLDQRIALRTGDELEGLVMQFNRMAEQLQETHAMQEARIAERTHDLAVANEAKTRFLAAASHDLRQPMHALALFVGQLRAFDLSLDAAALAERIECSVEALGNLLEALLDLSKLDVGAVTAEPQVLPLDSLLSRLATQFAPSAEAKGLAMTQVHTSQWARSDPLLLERILINLIANALRYTDRGRILIGCRRRGEEVEVVVADTGIGIHPGQLPNVFQEFYRATPTDRSAAGGIGLGLAIVKRLADLLGHDVAIESILGKGTVVRVRLPRARPQEQVQVLPNPLVDGLRNKRVLIVDDDASVLDAMRGLLARWECEVSTATNCAEALAMARAMRPDVVLCDLNLADGEDGVKVVELLQRECGGSRLACAFVTGESSREAAASRTGHPVIHKPTSASKLRALIEHLLQSA